jgi:hypothetical protein
MGWEYRGYNMKRYKELLKSYHYSFYVPNVRDRLATGRQGMSWLKSSQLSRRLRIRWFELYKRYLDKQRVIHSWKKEKKAPKPWELIKDQRNFHQMILMGVTRVLRTMDSSDYFSLPSVVKQLLSERALGNMSAAVLLSRWGVKTNSYVKGDWRSIFTTLSPEAIASKRRYTTLERRLKRLEAKVEGANASQGIEEELIPTGDFRWEDPPCRQKRTREPT